jgi:Heterokaryon incompatibility protein Het-C
MNPKSVADEVLQCLCVPHSSPANVVLNYGSFHPDFHDRSSQIQREMLGGMSTWLQGLGHQQGTVLARLSKQAVRDHKNVRLGGEGASHSTSTTNAGSQSGFLQGIPSLGQAQGLYNQFGGGSGGRRDANEPYGSYGSGSVGSGTGHEAGPPAVPVYGRPGGGQVDDLYGDTRPFKSQSYTSSYPGGPASDAPPHSPGSHHGRGDGRTSGFTPPTQLGFAAPEQSSYLPPGSSYTETGMPSHYTGGRPPGSSYTETGMPSHYTGGRPPGSSYSETGMPSHYTGGRPPGPSYTEPEIPSPYTGGRPNTSSGSDYPSSYPGQSYPGQQGTGILGMPDPGNINPSYGSPQSNFPVPGTGPSFSSQGGRRFPDPQYDYGSGSGSGHGHGTYQPEY